MQAPAVHDDLSLSDSLLEAILAHGRSASFSKGELILSPDNDPKAFYYVKSGTVEVSYTDQKQTRITVALIGGGEFFGEIGFFDGATRVRDIQATDDVEVSVFDTEAMLKLKKDNLALYSDFIVVLTQKICEKFRRIAGEREPIAAYADSLSTRRSSKYTESKPLPSSLLNASSWHKISSRMEEFKSELFNLSHQLQQNDAQKREDEAVEQRCYEVLDELVGSLGNFGKIMQGSGYEEVMWGYVFKEIFPYFMRSHFAERAYYKPKGYAGDFLMMEHIYHNTPKGDGKLGKIADNFCLQRPGSNAIRGRRKLLKTQLLKLSSEIAARGEVTHIMNLACGPNRELFDFLAECEHSETVEALCVDIDSDALQYTNQHVNIFPHMASVRLMSENVIKWSMGRVTQEIAPKDIIYSAGLCDYLDTRLFRAMVTQCYNHLKPGGTLLLGNFTLYPDSIFLDKFLKWELIYRNEEDLKELFAPTPFGDKITVLSEKEHVNLFAVATKD